MACLYTKKTQMHQLHAHGTSVSFRVVTHRKRYMTAAKPGLWEFQAGILAAEPLMADTHSNHENL